MANISKFIKYWGRGVLIVFDNDEKILLNSISMKDIERIALKLNVEIEDRRV